MKPTKKIIATNHNSAKWFKNPDLTSHRPENAQQPKNHQELKRTKAEPLTNDIWNIGI